MSTTVPTGVTISPDIGVINDGWWVSSPGAVGSGSNHYVYFSYGFENSPDTFGLDNDDAWYVTPDGDVANYSYFVIDSYG